MINQFKKSPLIMILLAFALAITSVFVISKIINLSKKESQENMVGDISSNQPIQQKIKALGRIEPKDKIIKLSGPSHLFTGRIIQLNVKEGDIVNKGEVIAILDNFTTQKAIKQNAQNRVRVAQAKLNQVKAGNAKLSQIEAQKSAIVNLEADFKGQINIHQKQNWLVFRTKELLRQQEQQIATIAQLTAQSRNDKTECWRYETLLKDGAVNVSERDQKCLQEEVTLEKIKETQASNKKVVETLQEQINETQAVLSNIRSTYPAQISEAKFNLQRLLEVRPVDLQLAQAELEQTRSQLEEAEANLELTYIKAPVKGQILKIHTFPGESIGTEGIVELGQIQEMYVIAEVYETDIAEIRIGQTANINSNALLNPLQGKVEHIGLSIGKQDVLSTDPTLDLDARVFEVKIILDPSSTEKASKFINLQVEVEIIID